MTANKCKHYDEENGWCKLFTDWSSCMPNIEYCIEGPCIHQQPKCNELMINTKYNIGDTIWFADYFYNTFYPCKDCGQIYEINIKIDKNKIHIYYCIEMDYHGSKYFDEYSEDVCFESYEECTKWCKERNEKFG